MLCSIDLCGSKLPAPHAKITDHLYCRKHSDMIYRLLMEEIDSSFFTSKALKLFNMTVMNIYLYINEE